MRKGSFAFVLLPVVTLLCNASSEANEEAAKIFAEASQLVRSAMEAEEEGYLEALKLYERVMAALERLAREHPSSPAAKGLLTGYARVGPYTVTELKERVLPFAKMRAGAEEDLLCCATIFAERLESVSEKTQALMRVADAYLQAGQKEKVAGVLSKALSAAKTIHDPSNRARLLEASLPSVQFLLFQEGAHVLFPFWARRAYTLRS